MFFFVRKYKITGNIAKNIVNLNEPYLLLANHVGKYDPFILSYFMKKPPNFISSDAIMRDKFIGSAFRGLGAIPKKKGIRDSQLIREIARVTQNGGAIALFPEGGRTWDGQTLFIDPSIAKLIKLLKVPVVTVKMKGAYFFNPRWSYKLRHAKHEIDFRLPIKKEQIKALSEDDIMQIINDNIVQDDIAYQRDKRVKIKSKHRAEYLGLILYQCPKCLSQSGFHAEGNSFSCKNCQDKLIVNDYGFYDSTDGKSIAYDNPKDWLAWQADNLVSDVNNALDKNQQTPLFTSELMQIEHAVGYKRMEPIGKGRISLFIDRIRISYNDDHKDLPLEEVDYIGPQFLERLEITFQDEAYRLVNLDTREPGIKWEIAVNTIWAKTNQVNKISPYYKHLILQKLEELNK